MEKLAKQRFRNVFYDTFGMLTIGTYVFYDTSGMLTIGTYVFYDTFGYLGAKSLTKQGHSKACMQKVK